MIPTLLYNNFSWNKRGGNVCNALNESLLKLILYLKSRQNITSLEKQR